MLAGTSLCIEGAATFFCCCIATYLDIASRRLEKSARDAVCYNINYSAGCAAAIKQNCRTAEDFNLFSIERFYCHRVVRAGGREIERANTIFQYLDPRTI